MIGSLLHFIINEIIYRPFLNVLVLIYQLLPWGYDMGLALIFFTVILSLFLLPMSLRGEESEKEERELMRELKEAEKAFAGEPLKIEEETSRLVREHRGIIWSRWISYAIYLCYFIILYRVFKTGLVGKDLGLLYWFVPQPPRPLNLTLFGVLDLVRPSPLLNAVSAFLTFVAVTLSMMFSDLPPTREDRLVQFWAPIAAFVITYRIPAGQELFFTISLLFAMAVMLTREGIRVVRVARG